MLRWTSKFDMSGRLWQVQALAAIVLSGSPDPSAAVSLGNSLGSGDAVHPEYTYKRGLSKVTMMETTCLDKNKEWPLPYICQDLLGPHHCSWERGQRHS